MRIATQVWLCIAALAVGYVATVALDVGLGLRNQTLLQQVVDVAHPAAIRCQRAVAAFDQGSRSFELAVVFGDAAQLENARKHCQEAIDSLAAAAALPGLAGAGRLRLDGLAATLRGHVHRSAEVYGPLSRGGDDRALQGAAALLARERDGLRIRLAEEAESFSSALRADIDSAIGSAAQQRRTVILACVAIIASTLALAALSIRGWTRRLGALLGASDRLAQGDYRAELPTASGDEVGRLVVSFAAMREAVQSRDQALRLGSEGLERTVAERTHELAEKNERLSAEIAERVRAEKALAEANRRSMDASREAGRAEIATSVLHNVGNVLNSVNVSVVLLDDAMARSRAANLARATALLKQHQADLARFLGEDERGRVLPGYLAELGQHIADEVAGHREELHRLASFVAHIKDVIAMQQGYARAAGVRSPGRPEELCDDALRVHAPPLERIGAVIERRYGPAPELMLDRSRVLQVLINLVGNARNALEPIDRERRLVIASAVEGDRLRLSVTDNGVGIAPEVMPRLFTHGFTTRPDGHGFGLHASAIAAREMGGSLGVVSDGPGLGATFTLDIPAERSPA
jgi:C4-dicarboxylate-specific signal transduction histidine kinase